MSSESWFGHQSRLVRPSRDRSAAGSFTGQDSGSLLVFASIARFLSASPGPGLLGHAPPGGNCEGHVIFPMTVLNLLHERGPRRGSDERRVGKEFVSTCRSRGEPAQ